MGSLIVPAILALCSGETNGQLCYHDMLKCHGDKWGEIRACEEKYPKGMTIDDVYADTSCTQTFHKYGHGNDDEILRECAKWIIVMPDTDDPAQEPSNDRRKDDKDRARNDDANLVSDVHDRTLR